MPPKRPSLSVADTQLGFTPEELETFRRHQSLAYGQESGEPASRPVSAGGGHSGVALNPAGLRHMAIHFDRIITTIQERLQVVSLRKRIAVYRRCS